MEVLVASADLIRKALQYQDIQREKPEEHADYLAISQLGFRVVNDIGAATRLLDCGYFVQAAGLCRDIAEVGMLALLFSEKPETLRDWRTAGELRYRRFGRPALKGEISQAEKFQLLDGFFNTFSQFGTHPSAETLIAHHDGSHFHIGPHINKRLYIDLHRDLAFLTWHTTDACGDAYRAIFGIRAEELFPEETQRFIDSWEAISGPRPDDSSIG